jgi:phosphatidylcholine synthase
MEQRAIEGDAAPKPSPTRQGAAWAVHALTASGAVLGLMSLLAVVRGDARGALLWLGFAFVVDGLDGPFARMVRVRDVLPRVDGAMLDLIVDYLTYVLVPALFIYWFELLPPGWGLPGAGFILLTSLYCFTNVNLKTEDNYFVGFPAIWNVVVLYFWLLDTPDVFNLVVVTAFGVLTFVPAKFVHPLRVRDWRDITYAATAVWALASFVLVYFEGAWSRWFLVPFLGVSVWFAFVCLHRTLKERLAN